jgi:hypothetical protein
MPSYINIEDRYRASSIRERQMQYVWAATAAAVISVGATAAGTAMSYSASQKAGKAQAAASKKATRQEKKALKGQKAAAAQYEAEMGQVEAPKWDIGADIADAQRITGYNEQQLEMLYPGARNQRQLASMAISDYMKGVVPKDVQEQTQRMLAETGGAGFNFATAGQGMGIQAPQANLARSLGLTSLQLQQTGLGLSRDWQTMASAFIQSPLQVGQARLGFEGAAADIAMQKATNMYNARSGLLGEQRQLSGRQYERSLQQAETNLALDQARAKMIQDTASSLSSGVSAAGSAYSKFAQAKGASTTPLSSGFYQGEIGAANAYGVAPSQLSYQKPTGGFMGIGGQGGGYYYTPGGVYGRK